MNLFFDTSALAKLFHSEDGSKMVEKLHNENDCAISELCLTEFYSATLRKYREKAITEQHCNEILKSFDEQTAALYIEPLSSIIIERSKEILKKYGKKSTIRSLDALQIATYVTISDHSWSLVATDPHLLACAAHIGIKTINPCDERH
jgi:predicted nucleic acid-binding protein